LEERKWSFWPVLLLAFIFALISPLIMIATPIYFFQQGVQIKIISFLSTAITITYSFSPIILNKISNKLGRKNSVIIATIGAAVAQFTYYITLDPLVFLLERLFEGFILGFFFPNLLASISDNPNLDHSKYLAKFNLSWSLATVFGLTLGTIILLFTNNLKVIFYISPIFLLINVFIAILFLKEPIESNNIANNPGSINVEESGLKILNQLDIPPVKFFIPVIIPVVYLLALSFASANVSFLYPIKSEILGFQVFSVYFLGIFSTSMQSLIMYIVGLINVKKLKLISIISVLIYVILVIFFAINKTYYIFLILFIISGTLAGIMYGTASKLFILLNVSRQTSIYSSISESLLGVAYFISQVSLGFVADIELGLAFYSLSLIMFILFLISVIYIRKLKEI